MREPHATPLPDESAGLRSRPKYSRIKRVAMFVGLALLAGALYSVVRQHEALAAARRAVADMPAQDLAVNIGVLGLTVVLNIVLSGAMFSVLIRPYGRVGVMEMQSLIAAATLLNYVPLRPGLFGRLAYHRAYNNIPLTDSVKTVIQAAAISAAIAGALALAVLASVQWGADIRMTAIAPLPVIAALGVFWKRRRLWCWAISIRWLELLVIAARYHAAFALVGSPIEAKGSIAFACISMIAGMVPFLSSGLGVREWAVGLVAPLLTGAQMATGLTADLVNRAAELLVVLVCGILGLGWLMRHRRQAARSVEGIESKVG